jgi:hypothetical protein
MKRAWCMLLLCSIACGGAGSSGSSAPGGTKNQANWPADDRTMCGDWKHKADLVAMETAGPGTSRPNIRRVFKIAGEAESRRQVLVCREIDTNLDGIKDTARTFNPKGEAVHEETDTDFDGKVDVWANFVDGKLAEEQVDTNRDGKADAFRFYIDGQLHRIRRDRNLDGKPDIWEFYSRGRLERIGTDENADGRVDRWDRDAELRYDAESAEKKAAADAGASEPQDAGADASFAADAGAARPKSRARGR